MIVETRVAGGAAARRRPLGETLAYLPGAAPRMFLLFLLLLIGSALPVAASLGMKQSLDALPGADLKLFLSGLLLLVSAFSGAAIVNGISAKLRTTILETIGRNQRQRIIETALSLPLLETDRLERGDVVSRLSADVTESAKLVGNIYLIADILLKAASAAAYMILLSPEVGLVVLACNVVVVLAARLTNRGIPAKAKAFQGALGAMSAGALNVLEGRIVIKAFLASEKMERAFDERARAVRQAGRGLAEQVGWATFWTIVCAFLPLVAAFGYGSYMVAAGQLSVGGVLALFHLCDYLGPLALLGDRYAQSQRSIGALERVQEFVARRPVGESPAIEPDASATSAAAPAIEARAVSFAFGDGKPVLDDVSLVVPRGARVAVMGRSGSGKSTLLKVLAGLYLPSSGSVSVNGAPAAARGARSTYQPQEPFVFPGTIRDNLLVADADATAAELLTALAAADAADFVAGLDAGLETEAGERGGRLSGGQRQRLALARTLLSRSAVLLLDEPTGSLDRESEARVLAALQSLPNTTWVMVTHRFQTAEVCDRIIVMDQGRVTEAGTHTDLLAKRGLYWSLYTGGNYDSQNRAAQEGGVSA